jgi:hypothetical protein
MELASQLLLALRSYSLPVWATIISGLFVAVSLSLSLFLLFNHLSAYKNPEVGFVGRFLVRDGAVNGLLDMFFTCGCCVCAFFRSRSSWSELS